MRGARVTVMTDVVEEIRRKIGAIGNSDMNKQKKKGRKGVRGERETHVVHTTGK